jgi:hypothetical protein
METPQSSGGIKAGMIGGLLFVFVGMKTEEIVKTIVLAVIGASVSFVVTLCLKWLTKRWK